MDDYRYKRLDRWMSEAIMLIIIDVRMTLIK